MKYRVVRQVSLDRKLHAAGSDIELDPDSEEAKSLLRAGAIAEPEAGPVERIRRAIEGLGEDGYTAGGLPKTAALSEALGHPVTAAERDAAWAAHQSLTGGSGAG